MKKVKLHSLIPEQYSGRRLDQILPLLFPDYSRSQLQKWIKAGCVRLDKTVVTISRQKVMSEQEVCIEAEVDVHNHWQAQAIDLEVVYEDEALLVVNKPAGLVVHPGAGNTAGTLANALAHYDSSLSTLPRNGLIHRLDKDTSGLLIVAKTDQAYGRLVKQLQARDIHRHYEAIVKGVVRLSGYVEAPIGRHPIARTKMAVNARGKAALTHYRVLTRFAQFSHLSLQLESGRTHQIRVHMAHIRHPVVCDSLYGRRINVKGQLALNVKEAICALNRQALHACELRFVHPITQAPIHLKAPLPDDMAALITALSN